MAGSRTSSWKSIGPSDRGTASAILRRDSDKTTHNPNEEKSGLKRTLTARIKKEMEDIGHRTERLKGAVDGLSKIREAQIHHGEHDSGEDSGLDPGEGVSKDSPDSPDGPALPTAQPPHGVPTDDGPTTSKTQATTPAKFEVKESIHCKGCVLMSFYRFLQAKEPLKQSKWASTNTHATATGT
jgi:hypothetical protein